LSRNRGPSPRSPSAEPLAVRPKKSKKKQEDEGEKVNGGDEASSGRDSLLYTLVQRLQLQRQVNATSRRSWRVHTELAGASAQHAHAEQHAHLLALSCLSSSSSTRIFKMTVLSTRREPVGSEPGVPHLTRRDRQARLRRRAWRLPRPKLTSTAPAMEAARRVAASHGSRRPPEASRARGLPRGKPSPARRRVRVGPACCHAHAEAGRPRRQRRRGARRGRAPAAASACAQVRERGEGEKRRRRRRGGARCEKRQVPL
jgi:hypothetical protein